MKSRFEHHNEFNSPEEMLARAAFVLMLGGIVVGIVLNMAGVVSSRWDLMVGGGGAWLASWGVREWLDGQGKLQAINDSFGAVTEPDASVAGTPVAELMRLLQLWETLERSRGTPAFDPWALQSVRHDIHELVAGDPALQGLFHARQREHAA